MEQETSQSNPEYNLASMSDDDVAKFDISKLGSSTPEVVNDNLSVTEVSVTDTAGDDTGGADSPDTPVTTTDVTDSTSTVVVDDPGTTEVIPESQTAVTDSHQESGKSAAVSEVSTEVSGSINYKEEYDKVMSPFKAAKREIKLDNIDDARRLMQMGVDYSRKMEAMKPYQRVLKTLEKNNLLDIDRLNFLIDLDKKNPEAIKKFLKDSEIDPMDLTHEEGAPSYKPANHMVGDQEIALDDVLDDIRPTETFDRMANVLTKEWDTASRKVLYEQPGIIRTLNEHMQAGIFDQIAEVMQRERILGRLRGLSDLEAYKTVGDAIQARNGFAKPTSAEPSSNGSTAQQSQNSGSKSAAAEADELKNRRLAAGSPRGAANAGKPKINLADMTDEQISKLSLSSL